jgi:hypothetical protein
MSSRNFGGADDCAGALAARAAIAAMAGERGAEAALPEPILTTAASLPSPCIPGTASSLNGRFLIKSISYKILVDAISASPTASFLFHKTVKNKAKQLYTEYFYH